MKKRKSEMVCYKLQV